MVTKKLATTKLAQSQIVVGGLADGPMIIITVGPDGKLIVKKVPDPRPSGFAATVNVLAHASTLEKSLAAQITQAMQPAFEKQLRSVMG